MVNIMISQMVELFYIAFIALAGYGYHIVIHYGTIFEKLTTSIREKYNIKSTDDQGFTKQWVDHVLLGACPMCVAGNLAFVSLFVYFPDGLLMAFIRVFASMGVAMLINVVYDANRI